MLQQRLIKDQYTLIKQSELLVLFNMAVTNGTELALLYSKLMICLAIAVHDV